MVEDYTQPHDIMGSKGKFAACYERKHYFARFLPPLQPPGIMTIEERLAKLEEQVRELSQKPMVFTTDQWDRVTQLRAYVLYLQKGVNKLQKQFKEHITKPKVPKPTGGFKV